MTVISTYIWIWYFKPIWSFIINSLYWLFHLGNFSSMKKEKERLKGLSLNGVMREFKWKKDNYKDWTPWASTIIARKMEDDCDGAAALAKWYLKAKGMKSSILNLYPEDMSYGHAVCIVAGNNFFVSNDEVIYINPSNWKQNLFENLDGDYTIII
jgi:hypothetical protein